jgi:hypothetical protein
VDTSRHVGAGTATAGGENPESDERIRILFIAGASRSGSTLISRILGSIEGFFNCGELSEIWDRALLTDGSCSCGSRFSRCPVWQSIMRKLGRWPDQAQLEKIISIRDRVARSRRVVIPPLWSKHIPAEGAVRTFASYLTKLYRAVSDVSNAEVLVDSSKNVGYARLLSAVPSLDLRVAHLIRDPRATAYSWRRQKEGLWQSPPAMTALLWNVRNLAAEFLPRASSITYARFHYEEFTERPRETIAAMAKLAEKEIHNDGVFISDREVKVGRDHSLSGNSNRFQSGIISIRRDDEWKRRLDLRNFVAVTGLTWPFLVRYGYPLAR